jgi:hypothetical protein
MGPPFSLTLATMPIRKRFLPLGTPGDGRRKGLRAALIAAVLCVSAAGGWWYGLPKLAEGSHSASGGAPLKATPRLPRFAAFVGEHPSADVKHVADWAIDSGDAQGRSFVIIDKQDARVWLFDPQGVLVAQTAALLGAAVGDDPVPGIGEKPLSEVLPEEKTTPAGRFVAEAGVNTHGEDIVWVSYDLAVSMHRVRPNVKAERRLERLASPTAEDNRISFGCINLPVAFYEGVLVPAVRTTGAVVYVLPETRTPQQQFGSYDVAARWRGTRAAPA